jgi:hypothetical protein
MKKLVFLIGLAILFQSCKSSYFVEQKQQIKAEPTESKYIEGTAMLKKIPPKTDSFSIYSNGPAYPHGKPDDISRYKSYGYTSVTFTYYCQGGKYLVYTYKFQPAGFGFIYKYDTWLLTDTYTSNGICEK